MIRSTLVKNRLLIVSVFIIVFLASFLYYCTSFSSSESESCLNYRVKRTKVTQYEEINNHSGMSRVNLQTQELICYNNNELMDNITKKLMLDNKMMSSIFLILTIILSFYQFRLYIRNWIIQISQTKMKSFMVHYLQLKDGKKNALSFRFSF